MMYKRLDELEPGDRISQTLKHPRTGMVLITPNYVLDAKSLPRVQKNLKSAGYTSVLIHNPALQILEQYYEAERQEARAHLFQTLELHCASADKAIVSRASVMEFSRAIRQLCEAIKNSKLATAFIELWSSGNDQTAIWREKSAERSYLALTLALDVKQKALIEHNVSVKQVGGTVVSDLGYEDIGIGSIFVDVLDAFGEKATASLLTELEQRPFARAVIRQRYQRFDGTGRPSDLPGHFADTVLKGNEIHPYARIAHLTTAYADLHVGRVDPDRKGERIGQRIPARALWEMATDPAIAMGFDPEFLQAFLRMMQPYPLGHRVTLNTGESGVVIGFDKEAPWCPAVRVLQKEGQTVPEPYDLLLAQRPDLAVARFEDAAEDCLTFRF